MKLSEAQWAEAIDLYQADTRCTCLKIVALFKASRTAVLTNFKKRGVVIRHAGGRKRWPAKREQKLYRLRGEGLSFGKIAKRLKITRNAVAGKLNRLAT